jgi:pimeloyl-ACP methyl ester carboxylesterase
MSITKKVNINKVVISNGETIAYREREGGSKNILLIHGNMTSSKHWDLIMEQLDERYKLYALDLRGFGESSYNRPIQSIKDFSDDLKMFVDEMNLRNFSIIGWSTGGAVGMQYVVDYPGSCEKLVLLASASTRGYPFYGTGEDGMPDPDHRIQSYKEITEDKGKTIAVQTAYDSSNRDFLRAMWNALIYTKKQPSAEKYEEYIDDMLTQRNLAEVYHALNTFNISNQCNGLSTGTNQAKDIHVPVLVLRGDRDLVISESMTNEIVEDLGERASFVELIDCGHSPLVDDVEQLSELLSEFLN